MNEVPAFPLCFPNYALYREWKDAARSAKEPVNPCHDCSAQYMSKMKALGRCDVKHVEVHFHYGMNRLKRKQELFPAPQ